MSIAATGQIQLRNTIVSYAAIQEANFPAGITEKEFQVVQFCHDWLTGKEIFTLHTSGSTGTPKAITLTRRQMTLSARMTGKALGLEAGDRTLVNLNTQYIAGLMMLVRGLVLNLQVTVIPPATVPLAAIPDAARFDFLSFVPMQMEAILQEAPQKKAILNRAKAILLGGAAVNYTLQEQLQHIQAPVYHTYGMTETISHIALRLLNTDKRQNYFTVLPGVSISTDERNCLIIRTPVLENNPVVTNDVVELLTPGTFIWKGRIDNVINSGGVKVQAEKVEKEMEQVLGQLQIHRRFFVAGFPHPQLGEAVTLFMEGNSLDKQLEEKMFDLLRSTTLSRYDIPKMVHYISHFLLTPTGKIDKKTIVAKVAESR